MFIKPFKVKSNNQLKGTERKKLCEEVLSAYPCLTEEQVQTLLPKKEPVNAMKVVTHGGQVAKIFCVGKIPIFFQLDSVSDSLFPTIYTLWHHPHLLPNFTTHSSVISKLASGADLMLPGVILKEPVWLHSYGKLAKGTPVSIDTDDNKASIAVGITARSSADMYMSAGHGKCVEVLHVIGDTLGQLGKMPARPELGSPFSIDDNSLSTEDQTECNTEPNELLSQSINTLDICEDKDDEEKIIMVEENPNEDSLKETKEEEEEEGEEGEASTIETEIASDPVQEMDDLLQYCFLKACKTTVKTRDLPMLSSSFFKNHLIAACPADKQIDIKKSRYKKLSVFLAEMKEKGMITTSVTKGVESILSVQFQHPLLKDLVITEEAPPPEPVVSNAAVVSECYRVTADVLPMLSKFGYDKTQELYRHIMLYYKVGTLYILLPYDDCRKGDVMKRAEIRKCFTEYVKAEDLQDGRKLKLNPQLAGILKTKVHQETITMEDGINKFIGRMTHMHEVTLAGTKLLHTGKLEPIEMRVAVRAGGKKVTLINNLETFGINSKDFSKECQSIGASATITDEPGKKTPSVLVQGNQILHVYKLLTEKYQIKKTYIRGLEFAPKKQSGSHKK